MDLRQAVLVTGGAGYIGAHCCKALYAAGYLPVCYDNLSSGHEAFVKWGPLVVGDIADSRKVAETIAAHGVIAVMHFAAFSAVGESVIDPQKYYQNNLAGTLGLLQAMRETNVLKLVFSSTGAVYGQADSKPIAEAAAGRPINPYGMSKWMIEQVLADYRRAYGLNSFSLRYFNACGDDPDGDVGELRDPETHLIPRAMMALQGHVDFSVFGDDYATPDGTAIRDYIHVADLAAAHILALKHLLDGHQGGAFNLGTGSGFSVLQILKAIEQEAGRAVPHVVRERRAGDPEFLVADSSAAFDVLGFRAVSSDLTTIVRTAWAWHRKAHPLRTA
ncbi:UDP-glucose 4-epimerase GalE [Tardiphaga sp.]|jgi:UDP-glucose-4-epimerase GalE|uniref:UDP-glucose 4-epimerase GalE n=1 Tax=Tardiphaga sp. TaxID=1926292 RepID=UPI0037D9EDAB